TWRPFRPLPRASRCSASRTCSRLERRRPRPEQRLRTRDPIASWSWPFAQHTADREHAGRIDEIREELVRIAEKEGRFEGARRALEGLARAREKRRRPSRRRRLAPRARAHLEEQPPVRPIRPPLSLGRALPAVPGARDGSAGAALIPYPSPSRGRSHPGEPEA